MILTVTLIGCVLIGLCGFLGRRKPSANLAEWTVGGRNFGTATMWFLQAGEVFTTFTFLAVAAYAFGGGVAATYAIPYLPIAFIANYFLVPRIWALGKKRGYLTQADFFADRYRSKSFGRFTAVVAIVFLLPYLQIQISGLGLIVELVTGSHSGGVFSMVLASVLVVAFVVWSGIRGIANTAYLKDALMLVAMVVLVVAVPAHFAGGIGSVFHQVATNHPQMLTVAGHGVFTKLWWFCGVLSSAIAVGTLTSAHAWPAYLSAGSRSSVRRNYIWMPIYQVVIILPVIIGFTGIAAGTNPGPGGGNKVLLLLAHGALPDWLTGVVAVAAASSAMVPAGVLCMAMSSLVANNLVETRSERAKLAINHGVVVLATGAALYLTLARPTLLGNMLLLTFAGLTQLAPAILAALGRRVLLSLPAAWTGLVVGIITLVVLTQQGVDILGTTGGPTAVSIYGLIALVLNIGASVVVEGVLRVAGLSRTTVEGVA